jgi:hypothetical protein
MHECENFTECGYEKRKRKILTVSLSFFRKTHTQTSTNNNNRPRLGYAKSDIKLLFVGYYFFCCEIIENK